MQYEEIKCHYCGKDLTEEEACGVLDEIACEKCKNIMETILEEDAGLNKLNNKYASAGMWKFLSGLGFGGFILLMYYVLELGWSDNIGVVCLLMIPVCVIVFIVNAIRRGSLRRKIKRELNIEYARRMGTIHHNYYNRGEEHIC